MYNENFIEIIFKFKKNYNNLLWYIGLSNADFKLYYKINLYEIVIYLNLYIGYLVNKCRNLNEYSNKKN